MSFRDFPLRYDIEDGSLKIFLSCGWFCIKCQFSMSISFKLGKVGLCCATKGRNLFRVLLFLSSLSIRLISFSRGRRRKQPAKKSLTQGSLYCSLPPPYSVTSVSVRISQSESFPAVMSALHKFCVHQR